MDKESILKSIFDNDPLGLLNVKVKNPIITSNDRLIESFKEINDFVEKNANEPTASLDMNEKKLFFRLRGIREDIEKSKFLNKYDKFNLLSIDDNQEISLNSIDDILNNDSFGLLDTQKEEDIYTLSNIPKITTMPDYIASRKKCKDFEKYEKLFIDCQNDLKIGKRELIKFKNEQQIQKGYYFVLSGILLYVLSVGESYKKNGKTNARLKLIFENGTYSDMLLRSLSAELYKHGKRVSEYTANTKEGLYRVDDSDSKNGYIYILKSMSNDDRVSTKKDLYKIGFSANDVETRIKNASQDPTYLMADVKILSYFEVYNVDPHNLEQLIHKFFSNNCLDIDIVDGDGKIHRPREWFIAPINIIEEAISLIINGKIINYYYDFDNDKISLKI